MSARRGGASKQQQVGRKEAGRETCLASCAVRFVCRGRGLLVCDGMLDFSSYYFACLLRSAKINNKGEGGKTAKEARRRTRSTPGGWVGRSQHESSPLSKPKAHAQSHRLPAQSKAKEGLGGVVTRAGAVSLPFICLLLAGAKKASHTPRHLSLSLKASNTTRAAQHCVAAAPLPFLFL